MNGKNQHVVPHVNGWAVKGAGNQRATEVFSTQTDAIRSARQIAQNQGSEMLFMEKMDRLEKRVVMEATHFLQKDNAQSNERSLEEI